MCNAISELDINPKYIALYEEGQFYHIFNRASGKQLLFRNEANYRFFLQKLDEYFSPFLHVYAWCLLPNHFHLVVSVKEIPVVKQRSESSKGFGTLSPTVSQEKKSSESFEGFRTLEQEENLHKKITKQFKNFFLSYSLAYKKMHQQSSNVFAAKYKHILVEEEIDLCVLIQYVHRNPLHHEIDRDWQKYKWSSYSRIANKVKNKLQTDYVLDFFGGDDEFVKIHEENIKLYQEEQDFEF